VSGLKHVNFTFSKSILVFIKVKAIRLKVLAQLANIKITKSNIVTWVRPLCVSLILVDNYIKKKKKLEAISNIHKKIKIK